MAGAWWRSSAAASSSFVALIEVISMYGGDRCFLLYYLRFLGRHSWALSLTIAICHAAGLLLLLRRRDADHDAHGLPFTDPLFDVLYD
jgi:putative tricarboxylic transport membrane protein